jgi:hypothetical protein
VGDVLLWVLLAVLVAIGLYVLWSARRLDRLNIRVDLAAAALDAQLVRRASVAKTFAATAPLPPPAADRVATTARSVDQVAALDHDRELAESAVTRALMDCFTAPVAAADVAPAPVAVLMHDEAVRATLARRFYNDTVRDLLAVRGLRVVRWCRLAGSVRAPSYFEMDDAELALARISVASGPTIDL